MQEALRKGEKSLGAKMWAYSGGANAPYDVCDFRVSRHRDGPAEFPADYSGPVMGNCYCDHLSVVLAPGSSMTRMAYMSHRRRHVFEAKDVDLEVSAMPLAWMNQSFDIERRALKWTNDARTALRQQESKLILDRWRVARWYRGEECASVEQAWPGVELCSQPSGALNL